jgi:hypothetical protein
MMRRRLDRGPIRERTDMGRYGSNDNDYNGELPVTTVRKERRRLREREPCHEPPPSAHHNPTSSARVIKDILRDCVLDDPTMGLDQIIAIIKTKTGNQRVSRFTAGNLRREVLDVLRYLDERGLLTQIRR